jgi:hypothetical protein
MMSHDRLDQCYDDAKFMQRDPPHVHVQPTMYKDLTQLFDTAA